MSSSLAVRLSRRSVVGGGVGVAAAGLAALPRGAAGRRQATPAPTSGVDVDVIDRFASEMRDAYRVPGAALAIVHRGEAVMTAGYGVLEVGGDASVDADTVFQLASATKPMTSFTLATLVDEGAVEWTTPASEVLPELHLMDVYASQHADARDFLTHRSGLPAFFGDLLAHLGYDRAEMLRRLRYVAPGSTFRDVAAYSNLGYFIVGEMIDRLTGAPWEGAMRERLFEPLGMERSGSSLADLPSDGNVSANHATVDGEIAVIEADHHGVTGAAGSVISSANDMATWMQMLLAGGEGLVQPETIRTMFDPVIASELSFTETPPISETSGFSYGLGWGNYHWHGYEILEKGGALAGVRVVVDLVPELDFGIAVMANMNLTFLPEAIRAFALEQLIGPAEIDMQSDIQERAGFVDQLFGQEQTAQSPLPPAVPLENLAGVYEQELHGRFDVVVDGDSLRLEAGPAGVPAELPHFSLNTFLLDWGGVTEIPGEATFVLGPDGIAVAMETEALGRFIRVDDAT